MKLYELTFALVAVLFIAFISQCENKDMSGEINLYGETLSPTYFNNELVYLNSRKNSEGYITESTFKFYPPDSLLLHGFYKTYHKNGNLKSYINIAMGRPYGSAHMYHENGVISHYKFHNNNGELRNQIVYDINGKRLSPENYGKLESYVIFDPITDDSIIAQIILPDVPNLDRKITYTSPKCEKVIAKELKHGTNYDKIIIPRVSCDWYYTTEFYEKDSLVYTEKLLLTNDALLFELYYSE